MDPWVVALVIIAVLLGATAQSMTGFGFALIVMPLFLIGLDIKDAVVLTPILSLAVGLLMIRRVRPDIDAPAVTRLTLGSFAGMPFGLIALLLLPADAMRLAVSVAVLVMATAVAVGLHIGHRSPAHELAVGTVAGVLRTSMSLDGPPVVIYLQSTGRTPSEFRGVLTPFFLIGGVLALTTFALAGVISRDALLLAVAGIPAVYAGTYAGRALESRVDAVLFRRIVLGLLIAASTVGIITTAMRIAG